MTKLALPFNLDGWIEENLPKSLGAIGNKEVFKGSDFIFQIIKGPNARNDFHIDPFDEIFYQLKGHIFVHVIEAGARAPHPHRGRRGLHPAEGGLSLAAPPARHDRPRGGAPARQGRARRHRLVLPVLQHAPARGALLVRRHRARPQGRDLRLQRQPRAAHVQELRRGLARSHHGRSVGLTRNRRRR